MATLFVLTLIAAMFWMGITGNRFCCDPKSLVGQLRQQLLVGVWTPVAQHLGSPTS